MSIRWRRLDVPLPDPLHALRQLAPTGPGLLESPAPGPRSGRYSLLALDRRASFCLDQSGLRLLEGAASQVIPGDPFAALQHWWQQRRQPLGDCPSPFPGGLFGWFGYDLARWIEQLPCHARRDLPLPVLWLDWVDRTLTFDHDHGELILCSLRPEDDLPRLAAEIEAQLLRPAPPEGALSCSVPQPLLTEATFSGMVRKAQQYIASGDIYQANLSCRFDGRWQGEAVDLYRRLRSINPSPFACLLQSPHLTLVSSSPERLVSLRGDLAETRPIAGTRPRGFNPPEDHRLGEELLGHPKERAEHVMLLDLERNDLGKVCRPGTVEVDELMTLERYSHVTHIVSNVRGKLQSGCGPFDLLRAMFPGGTITGVPKKRCMEIIEELEPVGRGTYTGSAGYISATGEMDLNILIRTFQLLGDRYSYQAGAGIVADSDPQREWHECLAKGEALRKALGEPC